MCLTGYTEFHSEPVHRTLEIKSSALSDNDISVTDYKERKNDKMPDEEFKIMIKRKLKDIRVSKVKRN